jgi:hypothetical protein
VALHHGVIEAYVRWPCMHGIEAYVRWPSVHGVMEGHCMAQLASFIGSFSVLFNDASSQASSS